MSTVLELLKPVSASGRSVWAAAGVIVVTLLAIGAAVIHVRIHPEEPHAVVLSFALPADSTPAAAIGQGVGPVAQP